MIELINIQKSYPTQTLYQDLNLRLNEGDKVGLVGRNGTGKSTLFKLSSFPLKSGISISTFVSGDFSIISLVTL